MEPLPPAPSDLRDREHLKLLAIFHFVFAGLGLVGLGFLALHFALMSTVFSSQDLWANSKEATPPPREFFSFFAWVYGVFAFVLVTGGVLNLLSGLWLRRRVNRAFSFVVAALDCLQVPFGTVLGIFTVVVLSRDSVRRLYEGKDRQP
jgi:hypothetical protein